MNAPRWVWWLAGAVLLLVLLALLGIGVDLDTTDGNA